MHPVVFHVIFHGTPYTKKACLGTVTDPLHLNNIWEHANPQPTSPRGGLVNQLTFEGRVARHVVIEEDADGHTAKVIFVFTFQMGKHSTAWYRDFEDELREAAETIGQNILHTHITVENVPA